MAVRGQRASWLARWEAYDHVVFPTEDPNTFRVSYSDILTVGGETLTHMAEQHVTVVPRGPGW